MKKEFFSWRQVFLNLLPKTMIALMLIVLPVTAQLRSSDGKKPVEQEQNSKVVLAKRNGVEGRYIVVYENNSTDRTDANAVDNSEQNLALIKQQVKEKTEELSARLNLSSKVKDLYDSTALQGFVLAGATEADAEEVAKDPRVKNVYQDIIVKTNLTQYNPPVQLDLIDQNETRLTQYDPQVRTNGRYNYFQTGAGVNVFVLDTGILYSHPEFGGRAHYFADWVTDQSGNPASNGGNDCNGHGTEVASQIGGVNVGVAKSATLWGVRVLGCDGNGYASNIINGINYVSWSVSTNGGLRPAVANLSFGGGAYQPIDDAVRGLINSGVTVVVAAGNDSQDANNSSPARVGEAITVGASEYKKNIGYCPCVFDNYQASFSNFGIAVDIYAPGVNNIAAGLNNQYVYASGTSFSAPLVAGAAALTLQRYPSFTPANVQSMIVNNSTTAVYANPNRFLRTVPRSILAPDEYLTKDSYYGTGGYGNYLRSDFGLATLVYQGDNNLVLYKYDGNYLWATFTQNRETTNLIMQGDGNLVLYNYSTPIWWSGTQGNPGAYLELQDDRNLIIKSADGTRALWATWTQNR